MAPSLARCWRAVVAIGMIGFLASSEPARAQGVVQIESLSADLDRLAMRLSRFVAENEARAALLSRIEAAKEKTVALRDALNATLAQSQGRGAAGIHELLAQVQRVEAELARAGAPVPRLDLKLPVPAHHGRLGAAGTIYVVAAPLADESEVQTLTGYAGSERVTLDPEQPPAVPTLVVVPAESESLEPAYPLPTSAGPGDETNPKRADDFVGVAKILIKNDHESWTSGNPEIYVQIVRTQAGAGFVHTVDLPGVNAENIWYDLGDPNSTYLFFDSTINSLTTIAVWERDSFAHGADDFLGSVTIDWTALPATGYTAYSDGDMEIRIDRD